MTYEKIHIVRKDKDNKKQKAYKFQLDFLKM